MTGSNAVLIVVPLVMLPALALWLGLVMYAGNHPEWRAHRLAREAQARESQSQARQAAAVPAGAQAGGVQAAAAAASTGGQRPITPRVA